MDDLWIAAGVKVDENLPKDTLTQEEAIELNKLLSLRHELIERLNLIETKLELFVLSVRDHRGLQSKIRINPKTRVITNDLA